MHRALLLALLLCGLLAPNAVAGQPFTVGEGRHPHLALGPADTAHIVWSDAQSRVHHCRLPRGAAACDPLTTFDIGSSQAAPFALVGGDGAVYVAMPHYVDERTYLWRSTDDGRTFGPRQTIYAWGGGDAPTEPVLGPQPGQVTFAAWNRAATVWSAALDGSEAGSTARATLTGSGDYDFQVAPTTDGGLVAVGNDLQTAAFHRMPPGEDPSDAASWTPATPLGGQDDTTRVAGGKGGTYMLSTVGPTDAHMNLRRWSVNGFEKPVEIFEFGYVNDVHVGPSGTVAAIWRENDPNGNLLRLALSEDAGATYATSTIAVDDALMTGMDVALAPDGAGLAVYEREQDAEVAQRAIRVANTTPVEAVSPNPPALVRRTAAVPGATLRLDVPGNCLELDSSFLARVSAKRRGGRRSRFRGLRRVDFFLGAVRLRRDRSRPFLATIVTDDLKAKQKYTVRVSVTVRLTGGRTARKSLSAPVQAC
ncbi:MAG: hypothetical protein M3320_01440 [Actinomycetota bacterium]|nr:hypothetical protein [Actinomycetota bacterium]MDQ5807316.1 hypothetical protein [Actinomycetota bacterium]